MPSAPRSGASRIWGWSALFALWSAFWPGLILLAAAPRRDIVIAQVERAAHMPVPLAFASLAVAAFVLMASMLTLRRRFDVEGEAASAMRWSLSSRSLDALLVSIALLIAAAMALAVRVDLYDVARTIGTVSVPFARFVVAWWWLVLLLLAGGLTVFLPFCLANPDTLKRDRLQQWWRPSWPGTLAVLVAPLLWIGWPALVDAAMSRVPEGSALAWVAIPLTWLLIAFGELVGLALWLNRSAVAATRVAIRRMASGDVLRHYLGLRLGWWVVVLWFVVPLCVRDFFAAHLAPQGGATADSGTMRGLFGMSHAGATDLLLLPAAATGLFLAISTARLLVRLGVAPPAGHGRARREGKGVDLPGG